MFEPLLKDLTLKYSGYKPVSEYLKIHNSLQNEINRFYGLKTCISLKNEQSDYDKLKYLLLFNDFISVNPRASERMSIMMYSGNNELGCFPKSFTISNNLIQEYGEAIERPVAGFVSLVDDDFKKFAEKLLPFQSTGKLVVRPEPVMFVKKNDDKNNSKNRYFKDLKVDPDSDPDCWQVIGSNETQDTIPIVGETSSDINEKLFKITIPFIDGVEFDELSKILEDESDYLSSFRNNLKELVTSLTVNDVGYIDIYNDKLRPEVDKLERRFKHITNMNLIKQGGGVLGFIAIGLLSLKTQGLTSIINNVLTVGNTGLLIKNKIEYINDINELKENPYYLLWKLGKPVFK